MKSSKRAEKIPWTKSRKKPGRRKRRRFVVPKYNNVNGKSFRGGLPLWGFVHTRFQISNKEFVIISMKDISGQLELKYIKAKNLKIKRSRFCGDHVLFGSHSCWLGVWFSGGCHNFPSLSLVSAFSLYCFYRSFSPWFNWPFFRSNHYSTVFDCDCKTSREFNGLFMLRALGCQKLVFHWSAAWLSWPPLWWGVISF